MEVPSPACGHGRRGEAEGGRPRLGGRAGAHARRRGRGGRGGAAPASPDGGATASSGPAGYGSGRSVETITVAVPDIGDFKDVPVITVFVKAGDTVKAEDPLIELESDKATMEVPSPDLRHGRRGAGQGGRQGLRRHAAHQALDRHGDGRHRAAEADRGARLAPDRARDRRHPRRAPGARIGPRRLHRRLPRRRPRAADRARRAQPDARRRLPQRRLHPVQGAAARRQGHHRGRGDGALRRQARQARGRHRRAARLEGERGQEADRRPLRPRQGPQGAGGGRRRPVRRPEPPERRDQGRAQDDQLRPVHRRGRLGAGEAAVHPPRRPAGDRIRPARSSSAACRSGCW